MVVLNDIDDYYDTLPNDTLPCFRQLIHSKSCYFLGRSVNEYEHLHEMNRGSYGVVYRARNNETNQIVAMKKMFDGLSQSTLTEIQILESLPHHPSIVKFNDIVMDKQGCVFLVMEYMEKDLQRFMNSNKQDLTLSEVKFLMKQILEGVNFLHKQGIMHRDLKPQI